MTKYNLGGAQANNIAGKLMPNVLSGIVNKSNDSSNNGFSLENILHSNTGGQSTEITQQHQGNNPGGGLQDILGKLSGGGGGGIGDILSKLAGGAQAQQQKNNGNFF